MKKLMRFLKDKNLVLDTVNIIISILLLIFIVLIFINPSNPLYMLGTVLLGGFMNMLNGLKHIRGTNRSKKNMGMSMILVGAIIMILGMYFFLQIS
ncbi:MAG: hypothetical protein E7256_01290 [Lachnospiraceae bacterium]|nr:hypothetical protein [Lachnospiraceae bacterium]